MTRPPNILFLMTDQHRFDLAGFAGNEVIRTPRLDALAETAVVFDNAYTPSPICMPGRACIMAGQRPSTCDCREYFDDLPTGHPTWPRMLAALGYQTVCCGKLHHHYVDQGQGFLRLIGMHPQLDEHAAAEYRKRTPGLPDRSWSPAKEIRRSGVGYGGKCLSHDEYTTIGALKYIEEHFCDPWYDRATPERPLCLKVSMESPHNPYFIDEERFNYYLNRVPVFDDAPADHPYLGRNPLRPGEDFTPHDLRRMTAAYYGMVENIDSQFGQVLDALAHAGQDLDDWIVVFTSDHGEMLGQHGLLFKGQFYEASARVPLMIRWPKRFDAGRRVAQNVSNCDLFATFAELVGGELPEGTDSRSLVPLLEGRGDGWDNEAVSEYFVGGATNLMIKRDALKYQWYGDGMPEALFDLSADPAETTSVIDAPEHTEAVAGFRARRDELGFVPAS